MKPKSNVRILVLLIILLYCTTKQEGIESPPLWKSKSYLFYEVYFCKNNDKDFVAPRNIWYWGNRVDLPIYLPLTVHRLELSKTILELTLYYSYLLSS